MPMPRSKAKREVGVVPGTPPAPPSHASTAEVCTPVDPGHVHQIWERTQSIAAPAAPCGSLVARRSRLATFGEARIRMGT